MNSSYKVLCFVLICMMLFSVSCINRGGEPPEATPSVDTAEETPVVNTEEKPDSGSDTEETPSDTEEKPDGGSETEENGTEEETLNLPVTEGLLVYWKFDEEGDTAKDSSGNEMEGTIKNASRAEGKSGQALEFKGEESIITVDLKIDQTETSPGATFCVWVYPDSVSDGRHQLISFDNGEYDWSLLREEDKWHVFNGDYSFNTELTVDTGKWQFLSVVFDPKEGVIFYKDDQSVQCPDITFEEDTGQLAIGENPSEEYLEPFDGKVDEVIIYGRPLSEEEIGKIRDM